MTGPVSLCSSCNSRALRGRAVLDGGRIVSGYWCPDCDSHGSGCTAREQAHQPPTRCRYPNT